MCVRYILVIYHFLLSKLFNVSDTMGQRCGVGSRMSLATAKTLPTAAVRCYYGNTQTSTYMSGFGSWFVNELKSTEFHCLQASINTLNNKIKRKISMCSEKNLRHISDPLLFIPSSDIDCAKIVGYKVKDIPRHSCTPNLYNIKWAYFIQNL